MWFALPSRAEDQLDALLNALLRQSALHAIADLWDMFQRMMSPSPIRPQGGGRRRGPGPRQSRDLSDSAVWGLRLRSVTTCIETPVERRSETDTPACSSTMPEPCGGADDRLILAAIVFVATADCPWQQFPPISAMK